MRCDVIVEADKITTSHFNPRTSCEVRLSFSCTSFDNSLFQSTHLVWGATVMLKKLEYELSQFQSTHLVWGATILSRKHSVSSLYFNPRTSCEVRRHNKQSVFFYCIFQSTHLVWGATQNDPRIITAIFYFNPRTSCEVRRFIPFFYCNIFWISIHAPRVRCDDVFCRTVIVLTNFNPRTSCEVRRMTRETR